MLTTALMPAPDFHAGPMLHATPAERGAGIARGYRIIAWRSGLIELIDGRTPPGAIKLFTFNDRRAALVGAGVVDTCARHARNSDDRLVPGVPEANDDDDAADALRRWALWVTAAIARRVPRRRFRSEVQ